MAFQHFHSTTQLFSALQQHIFYLSTPSLCNSTRILPLLNTYYRHLNNTVPQYFTTSHSYLLIESSRFHSCISTILQHLHTRYHILITKQHRFLWYQGRAARTALNLCGKFSGFHSLGCIAKLIICTTPSALVGLLFIFKSLSASDQRDFLCGSSHHILRFSPLHTGVSLDFMTGVPLTGSVVVLNQSALRPHLIQHAPSPFPPRSIRFNPPRLIICIKPPFPTPPPSLSSASKTQSLIVLHEFIPSTQIQSHHSSSSTLQHL